MTKIIGGVALVATLLGPRTAVANTNGVVANGYASIYSPGVMGRVSKIRGLPLVGCMIATPFVNKVGVWVTVRSEVTGERTRCRTTDVVRNVDMRAHMATRHYVEFDNTS